MDTDILCNDICTNCRWKDHCNSILEELILEAEEEKLELE